MLAVTAEPFDSDDYYFEPKWDGLRCIVYVQGGKVEFQNRNLRFVTRSYPELSVIARKILARTAILDGEIVILRSGLPNFEMLQNRFGVEDPVRVKMLSRKMPATYVAFDLLHLNGVDLVNRPLSERKVKLAPIIKEDPHLLLSAYIARKGKSFFHKATELGFEGIIAKKIRSHYQIGKRSNDWLKIKKVKSLDCVIAGYTQGTGVRSSTFGALVVAAHKRDGTLVHLGNVGTGFDDPNLRTLMKLLGARRTRTRVISGEVPAPSPITWVKPQLVAEVGYTSLTSDKKLRFPRFVKLRLDMNPTDCILP